MSAFIDLTGKQFERLTVLNRANPKGKGAYWRCRCVCGNEITTTTNHLKKRHCKSCGCLREEMKKQRITHGDSRVRKHTKLYDVWSSMKGRCYIPTNTSYNRYGALGIKVCQEWHDYITFKEWAIKNGYKEGLSIERKDSTGDYEPLNCKWSTLIEQANNKKNNVQLTHNGLTKTLTEWAREYGLKPSTLEARLRIHKWSIARAIETPSRKWNRG